MKNFLQKYMLLFFGAIVFGGLLWGLTGVGQLIGRNLNFVNLLFKSSHTIEALVYIFIGLCTLSKTIYNMMWERPKDSPHIVFILVVVVVSGLLWGIVGFGMLFNANLNLIEKIPNISETAIGIINYTIGVFALFKLFNYLYNH